MTRPDQTSATTADEREVTIDVSTGRETTGREAAQLDSWTVGRARLVAFKADRLLSAAQRELGGFGEATLSADLAPDLLEASERVGEAIAVLARLQARLRPSPAATHADDETA